MIQLFDKFGMFEQIDLILCNPNKDELFSIGGVAYDRKYKNRFNALSELTFTIPYMTDDIVNDAYDSILYRKLIYIPDVSYFMITSVEESDDGIVKEKYITCQSLEAELSLKNLTAFEGTYQFYDYISPSGTLLGKILEYLPTWSIGTIDSSLTTLFRTFKVDDSTIYNFLMTTCEDSFQCVFSFDTIAKTISAYATTSAITPTDIYLSHDNLINKIDIKELSSELVTALSVKGAGNLSINTVNPLGSDRIYNFDYYKNISWMSQSLIDAIDAWEARILEKQQDYADLLTLLRENNETLITLTAELVDLNADMDSLVGVQGARIQQGIDYSDINVQIASKQAEIDSKQAEIDSVNVTIGVADINVIYPVGSIMAQLTDINTYVSFTTNFTTVQQNELSSFIMGNTYNNENFVQTDIMTQAEIQDQAQQLFDQATAVLAKISAPRYEFSVDAINFVFLQEFQTFITQIQLGCSITLELKEDTWIYPVLLGIDLNYDDPTDFTLTFGNRLRLDDSSYEFSDLFGQTVNQGITTSFNSEQWGSWNNNYKDDVSTFITSSLDASKNSVISGSAQNVLINQNGIRVRSLMSGSNIYNPEQLWINNGIIAFTKDNWNTASLALGKISTSSGSAYGLVGEVLVGRILAGNNLTITNDSNTFTVNGAGATLTNATLTINKTSGNSKILLDPVNGIKIQGLSGGTWTDRFYADSAGNLTFKGALSGATGTFSGTLSAATISGGTITGASINGGTISGTTGTFSGNVSAANLVGLVTSDQINSLIASKIGSGTMSNVNLSGGRGSITVSGTGNMRIETTTNNMDIVSSNVIGIQASSIECRAVGGGLTLEGYPVSIRGNASVFYTPVTFTSSTTCNGDLYVQSGIMYGNIIAASNYVNAGLYYAGGSGGITANVTYYNGSTYRTLYFKGGICIGY